MPNLEEVLAEIEESKGRKPEEGEEEILRAIYAKVTEIPLEELENEEEIEKKIKEMKK